MTIRFIAVFFVLTFFALTASAQDHLVHTPWKLEGAYERIENIRKGEVQLAFVLDGKPLEDKASPYIEIGLKNCLILLHLVFIGQHVMKKMI